MFFLDTNICIYFLNGTAPTIQNNLLQTPPNEIKIPVIVQSELIFGALKSNSNEENIQKLRYFLEPFEIIDYTKEMSEIYAELRFSAESNGKSIGPNDLLIASIVVANNGTLVTRNNREFSVIKQLTLTEW